MHIFLRVLPAFFFLSFSLFAQTPAADSLNLEKNRGADIYLSGAKKHFSNSKTDSAFIELLKAQALYQKTGNKKGQVSISLAFADYYDKNKLWSDAERYYQKALLLTGEKDSTEAPANIAFRLAKALYNQSKYQQALKYNGYALKKFTDLGLKNQMAECYVQIARIERYQKNYKRAESLILNHALPLFRSADNNYGRISCFDLLGHIYHEQKRHSEAKWFFIQANTQARKLRDTAEIIISLVKLGKVKIDIKDYALAIRDFTEAEELAKETKMLSLMGDVKEAFGIVYKKLGNENASVKHMNASGKLRDSFAGIQKNRNIAAIKAKSDADKFMRQESVQKESDRTQKEVNNKIYIYFISVFVVLVILAGVIWYRIKRSRFGNPEK